MWVMVKRILFFILAGMFGLATLGGLTTFFNPSTESYNKIEIWLILILGTLTAFFIWLALTDPKQRKSVDAAQQYCMTAPPKEVVRDVDAVPSESFESYDISDASDSSTPTITALTLQDSEALQFWNGKRTDYKIPPYYFQSAFGRNVSSSLQRLLEGGYLGLGDMEKRISVKTVPELKAILAEQELKVSGNKKELIHRLLDNVDEEYLEELFPVNEYFITKKGLEAIEPYSIVKDSEAHGLGLSKYRMIKAKESHPEEDNNTILTGLLSEDIQDCYRTGDKARYQNTITTTARFLKEIGEYELSFECYSLSFFVWAMEAIEHQYANPAVQAYYMSLNIEEAAQDCGYDFDKMIYEFKKVVQRVNPFALASRANIEQTAGFIKTALGMA